MSSEKIYEVDKKSKKIKVKNDYFKIVMIQSVIITIIALIIIYIVEQILNKDGRFLIILYLLVCIYFLILKILRLIKFIKLGKSYILRNNDKMLIFYGDTSLEVLKLINVKALLGIHAGKAVSSIDRTVGTAISVISALKSDNVNNKKEDCNINEMPNITIDDIINDPRTAYDYYKNVKFIKKNKNYLYFNGDKNNYDGSIKNKNFKIDRKLYKDIDDILN